METLRTKLKATPQLGLCVMYPSAGVVERIGADWDWVWIDGQHGELSYHDILGLVRACDLVQRPSIVRVPGHEFGHIGLALDTGAGGVMVPQVNSAADAKAVVRAAKFPPVGDRSYGGRRPIDRAGRGYADTANDDTILICQIESPEAVASAEAIAAVPGVDALFLGPDDVMLRRGFSMTKPRSKETLGKDLQVIIDACRNQGKIPAMVGIGAEMLTLCLQMGFKLIVGGGDVPFLANGSQQAAKEARALLQGLTAEKPAAGPVISSPY